MKLSLVFVLFILCTNAIAAMTLDERRQKITNLIDQQIREAKQLAYKTDKKNPDHLLRISELFLEKAKLWKEKENEVYLAIPAKKRAGLKKSNHFRKSAGFFKDARNTCKNLLKRFGRYKKRKSFHPTLASVYYILAYDAKEFRQNKSSLKYFKLANRYSGKRSITKTKAQVSLAEIYYNKSLFRKAIPLYEKSLKNNIDQWWTKDALSLAWCYYRVGKYSKAISWMKAIYNKSAQKQFIDVRSSVLRDIGLFYADSKRTKEGIAFYRSKNKNFSKYMLKLSSHLKKKGSSTLSIHILYQALKYERDDQLKLRLTMELLELYDQFNKLKAHYKASVSLLVPQIFNKLSGDQKERLKFHLEKKAAEMQKKVVSKLYKKIPKTRRKYAEYSIKYFELSKKLKPKEIYKIDHFIGETLYSIRSVNRAIKFYVKSFDVAIKVKDKKIAKLAMEGMLACLSSSFMKKSLKERYYTDIYTRYIDMDKKSKRSQIIRKKLFQTYFTRKQLDFAEETLNDYIAYFPKDIKVQEAMVAQIMEYYRKKKNNSKIKTWIRSVSAGKYKVGKNYKRKLKLLLTSIQMGDVENLRDKGEKAKALREYHKIYSDAESSPNTKKNAAYNLALLFYELRSSEDVGKWADISMNLMSRKEVKKFIRTFMTFSSYFFESLEFEKSIQLSEHMLKKFCKYNLGSKEFFFSNSAILLIAENRITELEKNLTEAKRCSIPAAALINIHFNLLEVYAQSKSWTKLKKSIMKLEKIKKYRLKTLYYQYVLGRALIDNGSIKEGKAWVKKFKNRFYTFNKKKATISNKVRDIIANDKFSVIRNLSTRLKASNLKTGTKRFESNLKRKYSLVTKLQSEVSRFSKIGSGNYLVQAYIETFDAFKSFADELKGLDASPLPKAHRKP
ncbi:MAG: hypothetical protein ACI9QD_000233, partial [Thermoproteota archaeon]